jgi:hypothetical protein
MVESEIFSNFCLSMTLRLYSYLYFEAVRMWRDSCFARSDCEFTAKCGVSIPGMRSSLNAWQLFETRPCGRKIGMCARRS